MNASFISLLVSPIVILSCCGMCFAETKLAAFDFSAKELTVDAAALNAIVNRMTAEDLRTSNFDLKATFNPRMIGGGPADIKDTPWEVALVFGMYPDPARAQFCGGSVIADSWAVTAAHCVLQPGVDSDPHRVDLVANTTFYKIGGDRVHVTAIYPNPHYDPRTSDSDIALLRLAAHTQPLRTIDIPNSTDPLPPETHLLVAGWGALIEGGSGSDYLVSAKMPVVSNTDCNKPESYDGAVTDNMFCAGLRSGGLDACQGDSGGPAVAYDDASHRPMLEGVIATGKGCARALKYGVYTAVRRFRSWIDQTIAAP